MDSVVVSGSLRNRLVLTLIGGAAVLALILFVVVRNYAVQVAQQAGLRPRIGRGQFVTVSAWTAKG